MVGTSLPVLISLILNRERLDLALWILGRHLCHKMICLLVTLLLDISLILYSV